MRALQKKRAHGDSSHDVSNRWVGSQRSVPNLNACPAMVPIALSLRIALQAGGILGGENAPKSTSVVRNAEKPKECAGDKEVEGQMDLGLGKVL